MAERVGIVAVGQTKYHPDRSDVNEEELAYEAIKQVLEATGLALSPHTRGLPRLRHCYPAGILSGLLLQYLLFQPYASPSCTAICPLVAELKNQL